MRSWEDYQQAWSSSWWDLYNEAYDDNADAVRKNPEKFRPDVQKALTELTTADQALIRMRKTLEDPETRKLLSEKERNHYVTGYGKLRTRYNQIAAGIYVDARVAEQEDVPPELGAVQIPVLVVLGIALLTVGAITWAIASLPYSQNLLEQTRLQEAELNARLEAMRSGKALPPTTLRSPTTDPTAADDPGLKALVPVAIGGLLVVVGAGAVLYVMRA